MKSRSRSITGAVIAVFALPVFIGLTGCLPAFSVPVGDPEKSRIDPNISGAWMPEDEKAFYVFEPYDKRTWLLSYLEIDEDQESCEEEFSAAEAEDFEADEPEVEQNTYEELVADITRYGSICYDGEKDPTVIKVWRTKLGGEWFMTWEPLGMFDSENGFGADEWHVFKIDTSVPDQLRLWMFENDNDAWDAIENIDEKDITRRAVEKIIRKHADEDDFYYEEPMIFYRLLPEHHELFEDFLDSDW